MKIKPKLYLNGSPQTAEEGSLAFARNMKVDNDGNLVSDYGYENISALQGYDIVGHIVGLDNKIYLFTETEILEYDEVSKTVKVLETGWKYNGGEISGYVSTNISGEKILSIAEYINSNTTLIPLKHINLSFCSKSDDESIYTQAPKVPMCNLTLNNTYAKTIPNGTYVFFIRYKIRTDVYTNWYLCSCPIFGGTSTKINTLQGGLNYINYHTDSAKSFIFDVEFVNSSAKSLYKSFQLGFIISHDDSTNARAWKEFDINTTKIYFDYEQVTDINIDELLATTYEIYNVRNITSFKNKLYISNYIESNINENTADISKEFSIGYIHSDPNGNNEVLYRNMKLNGNDLQFNDSLGYYDSLVSRSVISSILYDWMFDYDISNLYKGETIEKDKIASFDIKWNADNNPDLCTVYNIFNDAYNNAVFGITEERLYNGGKIGIIEHYSGGQLWLYDKDTAKPHQWDDLGFTFIYGSADERDSKNIVDARNGVFMFNERTKHWDVDGGTDYNYWPTRDKGFSNESKAFIQKNIKDEIEAKNRFVYCYIEISSGAKTYPINFSSYMNKNNYIGMKDDIDYGFENANSSITNNSINSKIQSEVFNVIQDKIIGLDENGSLVFNFNGDIVRACSATVVFKAIKFNLDSEDIENDNKHFNKRFYVNAKITEWKSVCNFSIKENYITMSDTTATINQKSTLMPLSTYNIYAHYIDDNHIVTNGDLIATLTTDEAKSNTDIINLAFSYDANPPIGTKYKGFFFSIVNTGRQVIECFNYRKINNGNTHIVNCLEVDCLLYNINTNIKVIKVDNNGNETVITTEAKYYSSGSSYPVLAFGNCGYISWNGDGNYSNDKLYVVIDRNINNEKNFELIKCSPYYPLQQTGDTIVNKGFYGSYFCLVKKPDFDLSSSCYVSGKDIYSVKRTNALRLSEFNGYIQIQNGITYFIRSNFNLNYLSLTEDINDQIFSVGNASSGLKQVAKVINSATLSFIYELKSMYKDFMNKTFSAYDEDYKIQFDNTIRVSNVLSDETFNNSVFKFDATDYYNIPTDRGIIVSLFAIGNTIYAHTKGSLYKFDATQTILATNEDIKLQEAEPFEIGLSQVFDSQYGYGGIENKEAGCITFDSYFFYDNKSNHIFAYAGNNQIQLIDGTIYKFLTYYKPTICKTVHDIINKRILFEFTLPLNEGTSNPIITLSYNYKSKSFVSVHDITLNNCFTSINTVYSYNNNNFIKLFNTNDYSISKELLFEPLNLYKLYGTASERSYLVFTNTKNPFSIAIIVFPQQYLKEVLNSVSYIGNIIENDINFNSDIIEDDIVYFYSTLNICTTKPENPVKSFNVLTDICKSNIIDYTIDDTIRPNSLLDYKGFKYDKGIWNINYFRDSNNNSDIYKYNDVESDNKSLIYGKFFILNFSFITDKPIKFEEVFINSEKY